MYRRSRILKSPKLVQKKRKKLIITALLSFSCIILFIIFLILFFQLNFLQISSIEIKGNSTLSSQEIQQLTLETVEGYYFGLIPKSNSLFYPKNLISNTLTNSFKKIDNLKIRRKGLSGLKIDIIEKEPVALACKGFRNEEENEQKCYSVDENGFVFEESPLFSEGVYPYYYINLDDDKDIVGDFFIDTDLFKDLQDFIKIIKDSRISAIGILIGENGQYELYIKNVDLSESIIYFDDKISFEKTASNLIAFWNETVFNKNGTSSAPIFEYINLRFGNNIFYVTK